MKSKQTAQEIVEDFLQHSGVRDIANLDPAILNELLSELRIDDFDHEYIHCLKDARTPLKDLVGAIEKSIIQNQPALVELIKNNRSLLLTLAEEGRDDLRCAMHRVFLLQHLTYLAQNNVTFLSELFDHLTAKQGEIGLEESKLLKNFVQTRKYAKKTFLALKLISIQPGVHELIFRRSGKLNSKEDIDTLIADGDLPKAMKFFTKPESDKRKNKHTTLKLNIAEAMLTEQLNGYAANAVVARKLIKGLHAFGNHSLEIGHVHPEHLSYEWDTDIFTENVHLQTSFSHEWERLYEAWNIAFVLGDLAHPEVILPKLFIPSVIDAKQGDYMSARLISLWLTANAVLFRFADGSHTRKVSTVQRLLAKELGTHNKSKLVS